MIWLLLEGRVVSGLIGQGLLHLQLEITLLGGKLHAGVLVPLCYTIILGPHSLCLLWIEAVQFHFAAEFDLRCL